jgi:t-SNARE complex subunit (syntaxin)
LKKKKRQKILTLYSENSKELEQLVDEINSTLKDVKNKIQGLDLINANETGKDKKTQEKIRKNLQANLVKKFMDLIKEYQETQKNFQEKTKEAILTKYVKLKQIKYLIIFKVVPNATNEEIEERIQDGGVKMLENAIRQGERTSKAKDALNYIKNRSSDIERLERNIVELRDLFLDMAIMVEYQGEIIDVIEKDVKEAVVNTHQATDDLGKTLTYAKKSRKVKD